MELADLKTLVTVIEQGGIAKAARELNRVHSGITGRIQQLEAALGVKLFLREKKRLTTTPKGYELYAYAKRILSLVDEAESKIKGCKPGGLFRVGSTESALSVRLRKPLARLSSIYGDISIEMVTGTSRQLH